MPEANDAAERFIRDMKVALRPDLINDVPDEFFELGREAELSRRVMEVIDARLNSDKIPIGRQLRLRLIESIMADISRAREERSGEN